MKLWFWQTPHRKVWTYCSNDEWNMSKELFYGDISEVKCYCRKPNERFKDGGRITMKSHRMNRARCWTSNIRIKRDLWNKDTIKKVNDNGHSLYTFSDRPVLTFYALNCLSQTHGKRIFTNYSGYMSAVLRYILKSTTTKIRLICSS